MKGRAFLIVLWKNFLLKRKHFIQTATEIIIPVLLFVGLALIRSAFKYEAGEIPPHVIYGGHNVFFSDGRSYYSGLRELCGWENREFYVAPSGNGTVTNAQRFADEMNTAIYKYCYKSGYPDRATKVKLVSSEDEIVSLYSEYAMHVLSGNGWDDNVTYVYGGMVVHSTEDDPDLVYTVRFGYTNRYYDQTQTHVIFSEHIYQEHHFLKYDLEETVFQTLIDLIFIQRKLPEESLIAVDTFYNESLIKWMLSDEPLALPGYMSNDLAVLIDMLLPLFTVLSFLFVVPPILKRIVHEKETGVKEFMRMMGLPSPVLWLAWFLSVLSSCLIIVCLVIFMLAVDFKHGAVIADGDFGVIFITFLLYSIALILMMFAVSTFWNDANLALTCGILVHLVSFFGPFGPLDDAEEYNRLSLSSKLALLLLPNMGIWWAQNGIMLRERRTETLGFGQLWDPLKSAEDELTLGLVWIMLLVDMVIFTFVIFYFDNVKPGPFGTARKPYFFLTKSYWCGEQYSSDLASAASESSSSSSSALDPKSFEPEPSGAAGIRARGLRKVFGSVVAVDDVSFAAFPGQITALLGHNGAGKTTTFSMLSGLFSPSGGDATVGGRQLSTELDRIRGDLGLCPQSNMLFPGLTVNEHLFFFAMLKGMDWKSAKLESSRVAVEVMLGAKQNKNSTALSGGMKRKLHLGIAIIGKPSVVMLDEPTSGMDPEARREIWDLLQKLKRDRTMLLTTHFMEEADVLGDRIAIMAEGKIRCYGSSLFLKKTYGSGYRLTMTKMPTCDTAKVKSFIRSHVSTATTLSNVPGELAMELPSDETSEDEANLTELLRELSTRKAELGVLNFGLSVTTLEDVFLRAGSNTVLKDEDDAEKNKENGQANGHSNGHTNGQANGQAKRSEIELRRLKSIDSVSIAEVDVIKNRAVGLQLVLLHFKALITKRAIQTSREWVRYLLMCLAPLLMALASGLIVLLSNPYQTFVPPPLEMKLTDYDPAQGISLIDRTYQPAAEYFDVFQGYIGDFGITIEESQNFTSYIAENAVNGIEEYGREYMPAMQGANYSIELYYPFTDYLTVTELTVGYNNVPLHSRPMAKNVAANVLHKTLLGDAPGSITATYHPILIENNWLWQWNYDGDVGFYSSVLIYAIMLSTGFMLFSAIFVFFPLKERVANAKQVQLMAGVDPLTFWLSHLAWDYGLFLLVTVATCGLVFGLDQRKLFTTHGAGEAVFLVYALYGFGAILQAYVFSFLTKSGASSFAFYVMVSMVAGVVFACGVWFMRIAGQSTEAIEDYKGVDLSLVSDICRYILGFIPALPSTRAIMAIVNAQESNHKCSNNVERETLQQLCTRFRLDPSLLGESYNEGLRNVAGCCHVDFIGQELTEDAICGKILFYRDDLGNLEAIRVKSCPTITKFFTWNLLQGINIDLVYLSVDVIVFLAVLILIEYGYLGLAWYKIKQSLSRSNPLGSAVEEPDEDVLAEQNAAKDIYEKKRAALDAALVVANLKKNFGAFPAVKGLSFTVKQGECFGLLGVNGAGKTTTFRMLTGDEHPTTGNGLLLGHDLRGAKREYLRQIGYCPQFDSIIDVLTGRQMLDLFAHIRGIRTAKERSVEVKKWAHFVDLDKYLDRACGTYSGGNKRKLNVAQALMGDPPVLFLDEPSTGVDPVARRRLWDAIDNIKKNGQSVVLTSHSMEECEALCNRLAIMVNGQFRCLGGPQHLKAKFGQGFTVIVKMHRANVQEDEATTNANLAVGQAFAGEDPEVEAVVAFMNYKFQMCTVKDRHKDYVHFHIGQPATPWHYLFETMQAAKRQFPSIADFSISETSLKEVFLYFARKQEEIKQ